MKKYNMEIVEKDLKNGLHVILIQKPDYQKSLFMCSAPVGGLDLQQAYEGKVITHRSGCAHFLEHQMFRLDGKDVTDSFASLQSQTNAFTSYNETAYYFSTTADIYEPLDLLLDFVDTLDIDEVSIEKEKGIILSEYDMYQQSPEQRLLKLVWSALYESHPMKVDILGTREDIQDMTVQDLQRFYALNYDPSRLVLVGITGGDLGPILEHIEAHQDRVVSEIKEAPECIIKEESKEVVVQRNTDTMDISTPYVCVAYKMQGIQDTMECELTDLAVQVRLDSLMSPLNPDYQDWLDQRIISQTAGCECDFAKDHGYILFYAQTEKPEEFEKVVEGIVKRMCTEEMDEKTFHSIRSRMIASNIRGLDQFESLAIDLIHAYNSNYSYWQSIEWIQSLTSAQVDMIVQGLDFSYKAVSTIYPNISNSEESL